MHLLSFGKFFITFCWVCWESNSTLIGRGDFADLSYLPSLTIFVGSASTSIASSNALMFLFSFSTRTCA